MHPAALGEEILSTMNGMSSREMFQKYAPYLVVGLLCVGFLLDVFVLEFVDERWELLRLEYGAATAAVSLAIVLCATRMRYRKIMIVALVPLLLIMVAIASTAMLFRDSPDLREEIILRHGKRFYLEAQHWRYRYTPRIEVFSVELYLFGLCHRTRLSCSVPATKVQAEFVDGSRINLKYEPSGEIAIVNPDW